HHDVRPGAGMTRSRDRMMTRMLKHLRDESGMAIITAMLLSMVVVTLGVTSVTIAVHNSEESAMDRRRVQGVAAAEAGINWYYSHLQSGNAATLLCSQSMTLPGTPSTSFSATATYYDASGNAIACPMAATTVPDTVLIRSVGTSTTNPTPSRTLESYVRLVPTSGTPFLDTGIYSNSSVSWPANVKILGNEASNTNVHVNGNATLTSSSVVYGSLYATGSITLRGNAQVRRDAWANTKLDMSNSARVLGNGLSSTANISVKNQAKIGMDATYCTSISAGSGAVGGLKTKLCQAPPPVATFPVFTYVKSDWESQGYVEVLHSGVSACTTAKAFIKTLSGTYSYVVRITEDCTLTWTKDLPTITGNLAIISDGGMTVGNNTKFVGVGGPWNLHMFFGIDNDGAPCNLTWGNGGAVTGDVNTLIYTPCTISFGSGTTISKGQLFGGSVILRPGFSMNYFPVPVPGFGAGGFKEDVLYLREVVPGS
ncbi:MAG: hypothetical protein ACRDHM_06355, partial [Actinomycetota bacterium]